MSTSNMPQHSASSDSQRPLRGSSSLRQKSHHVDELSLGLLRRIRLQNPDMSNSYAIGLASCLPKEGTSTIAMKLAVAAAETTDEPVIFVDTNVASRSSITRTLRLQPHNDHDDGIYTSRFLPENLHVFGWPEVELAGKSEYVETINQLRASYQTIIVDLPNANEMTPCGAIGRLLDGVVLVVEAERTKRELIQRSVDQLKQVGVVMFGMVYNKQKQHVPRLLR